MQAEERGPQGDAGDRARDEGASQAKPRGLAARLARFASAHDDESPFSGDSDDQSDDEDAPVGRQEEPVRTGEAEATGVVESIRTFNDWSIGTVWISDTEKIKVTGEALASLVEGAEYHFQGRWRNHPKHGESLDVTAAMPHVRAERASIIRFMERHFKGVGSKIAKKYLEDTVDNQADPQAALEALREVLLATPWLVDFSAYTQKASFKADEDAAPMAAFVHRDLAMRIGRLPGMKDGLLKLMAGYLVNEVLSRQPAGDDTAAARGLDPELLTKCWSLLASDPYAPIEHLEGYGFRLADAVGGLVGIAPDAPLRVRALIKFALEEGCARGGHTYLTHAQLRQAISAVDTRLQPQRTIDLGIQEKRIVVEELQGEQRYYTPELHDAESKLAQRVVKLLEPAKPLLRLSMEAAMELVQQKAREVSPHLKDGLDESQARALAGILTSPVRLHTLTAGPGCGKTALMEVLQAVLKSKDFCFVGPTGKAAKVLNNRLMDHGRSAATIHSTLQGSGRKDFQVNESDPLGEDVLVVDEASMADVPLADGVLAAVNEEMHVVLLGDPDQLPSVQPGAFLRDLLAIKDIDHHRLTTTHRNSGGILEIIEQVRQGSIDCVDRDAVSFSHGLRPAQEDFGRVATDYMNAVGRHGYENVILLMAKRKGEKESPDWNTTFANAQLREMCNPHAERVPGTRFAVNDRIIVRANMEVELAPALGQGDRPRSGRAHLGDEQDDDEQDNKTRVVNGDTGTIMGYQRETGSARLTGVRDLKLKLDDGRIVQFPAAALEHLQHSYALTVHSGQGSEYKQVIAVATPGGASFINRAMLFTALSRARDRLVVYGDDKVLKQIAATPMPARNSGLVRRVLQEQGLSEDEVSRAEQELMSRSAAPAPAGISHRLARFAARGG